MSYITIFHLSMMLISVFCVCFSVLPFFASLYFKQVNINYLEIHARSSIYIFWPMAYWLINTTRRKPSNFFLKVPYAYENQKSGYIWKFACLVFTISPYIGEISCMKVERSKSKWNMNHSCNRKVQWFGQKSVLVTQHLDFRNASYKTLVNIQHLKQNI